MARPCTICRHKDRLEIETASARGELPGAISARFPNVSAGSVRRHMADHAPRSMERAIIAAGGRDLAAGLGLNEEVADLQRRTLDILAAAEKKAKTYGMALAAIREARGNLELLGKFTGKLRPDTQVNVLVTSPDWLAMRERIAEALEPYPLALQAVKEAMSGE